MINFFKNIYYRLRNHIRYKRRLKELKKNDPFIY
jgi:hypothetical protein